MTGTPVLGDFGPQRCQFTSDAVAGFRESLLSDLRPELTGYLVNLRGCKLADERLCGEEHHSSGKPPTASDQPRP